MRFERRRRSRNDALRRQSPRPLRSVSAEATADKDRHMTLQAGIRLGPYEILSALGAGGCGSSP